MFGFFKKQSPSAMDGVIRILYGTNPPTKSADLKYAAKVAYEELLLERVSESEVTDCARQLNQGPIPYSTYDLATSVALSFFKRPELAASLAPAQAVARRVVATWKAEGGVVIPLAESFEHVMQKNFGDSAAPTVKTEKNAPVNEAASAASLKGALTKYFEAAVEECDRQFSEAWKFDPDWIGLLSVAADLDQVNGDGKKMEKIRETVMQSFFDSEKAELAAAKLLLIHLANQRQLEDHMRRSGTGKLYLPE